ncbi:MAG: cytochrome C oxidase subunit IV family protein [Rhodocyclaceae bacterium]|nr:cytochrome C oxidase subunit IV family protein [Rhodocyclaceae bacterium]
MTLPKNIADRVWLVMLAATLTTWALGSSGATGTWAVLVMLGLACLKGVLVILDFMELRHAPLLWRILLLGWLTLIAALIVLFYWIGST